MQPYSSAANMLATLQGGPSTALRNHGRLLSWRAPSLHEDSRNATHLQTVLGPIKTIWLIFCKCSTWISSAYLMKLISGCIQMHLLQVTLDKSDSYINVMLYKAKVIKFSISYHTAYSRSKLRSAPYWWSAQLRGLSLVYKNKSLLLRVFYHLFRTFYNFNLSRCSS